MIKITNFKEIVTKAVIGKAKKVSSSEYTLQPDETPDTILGCWVINHSFEGINESGTVSVTGNFDVNVWYSYNDNKNTKVGINNYRYVENIPVSIKDSSNFDDSSEIIVRSLRQPNVTDVKIVDGNIVMNIEKELGVEIVGDTKLKITVEDDEDDYEIITDDIEDVKEEYLDS